METTTVGFIGGGRITRIFLQGLSNKKAMPENITVFEPNTETLKSLKNSFPEIVAADSPKDAAAQNVVFIAVHPPVVMEVLKGIKDAIKETALVVSLAPKITLEKMASVLPTSRLARMIPNATSFINKGYNPITFSAEVSQKEKKQVLKLFKKLGKTFETKEAKLESYAIVSAMLPTYFWFQWQETESIAMETGLTKKEAKKAVKSTLKKAISLYYNSELEPSEVMDLIPVKPIGENEAEIKEILHSKLTGLFAKIKP